MAQRQQQELDRQIAKAAGAVASTSLLYHMAQSYLGFYQDHAQQFAESFDAASPQPWEDLDPQERNRYLVQAAVEHATADKDLLDDKFASRMADSAADIAREHESVVAKRAVQAREKPTKAAASPAADAKRASASASALAANLADRNRARSEGIEH